MSEDSEQKKPSPFGASHWTKGSTGFQKNNTDEGGSENSGAIKPSAFGANKPSAFGANKPSAFGANKPSAFGANKPSAFGANKPSAFGANKPSAFGANKPFGTGSQFAKNSNPFGMQKKEDTEDAEGAQEKKPPAFSLAKPSPFGSAANGEKKPSPFGSAANGEKKPSPFGSAARPPSNSSASGENGPKAESAAPPPMSSFTSKKPDESKFAQPSEEKLSGPNTEPMPVSFPAEVGPDGNPPEEMKPKPTVIGQGGFGASSAKAESAAPPPMSSFTSKKPDESKFAQPETKTESAAPPPMSSFTSKKPDESKFAKPLELKPKAGLNLGGGLKFGSKKEGEGEKKPGILFAAKSASTKVPPTVSFTPNKLSANKTPEVPNKTVPLPPESSFTGKISVPEGYPDGATKAPATAPAPTAAGAKPAPEGKPTLTMKANICIKDMKINNPTQLGGNSRVNALGKKPNGAATSIKPGTIGSVKAALGAKKSDAEEKKEEAKENKKPAGFVFNHPDMPPVMPGSLEDKYKIVKKEAKEFTGFKPAGPNAKVSESQKIGYHAEKKEEKPKLMGIKPMCMKQVSVPNKISAPKAAEEEKAKEAETEEKEVKNGEDVSAPSERHHRHRHSSFPHSSRAAQEAPIQQQPQQQPQLFAQPPMMPQMPAFPPMMPQFAPQMQLQPPMPPIVPYAYPLPYPVPIPMMQFPQMQFPQMPMMNPFDQIGSYAQFSAAANSAVVEDDAIEKADEFGQEVLNTIIATAKKIAGKGNVITKRHIKKAIKRFYDKE